MSWNETNISILRASVGNGLVRVEVVSAGANTFKYKINGRVSETSYASADDAKNASLTALKAQLESSIAEVDAMLNL